MHPREFCDPQTCVAMVGSCDPIPHIFYKTCSSFGEFLWGVETHSRHRWITLAPTTTHRLKFNHKDTPITEDDELVISKISMELEDFDQYVHAKPSPLPLKIFPRSSKVVCVSYVLGISSVDEQSKTRLTKMAEHLSGKGVRGVTVTNKATAQALPWLPVRSSAILDHQLPMESQLTNDSGATVYEPRSAVKKRQALSAHSEQPAKRLRLLPAVLDDGFINEGLKKYGEVLDQMTDKMSLLSNYLDLEPDVEFETEIRAHVSRYV
jgi:hypothetical protein